MIEPATSEKVRVDSDAAWGRVRRPRKTFQNALRGVARTPRQAIEELAMDAQGRAPRRHEGVGLQPAFETQGPSRALDTLTAEAVAAARLLERGTARLGRTLACRVTGSWDGAVDIRVELTRGGIALAVAATSPTLSSELAVAAPSLRTRLELRGVRVASIRVGCTTGASRQTGSRRGRERA